MKKNHKKGLRRSWARIKMGIPGSRLRRALPRLFALLPLLGLPLCALPAYAQTRLLRYPDIYEDKVVFTYGGDLWTASTSGGLATRLTASPGLELFGKFSPDGKWIAFTGQYDGDEQVYVIPATGGIPKQLTFYPAHGPLPARWGYDNQVYGWTPDGKSILFRSARDNFSPADYRLYTVPMAGGLPAALPMPKSGAGDFSPDASKAVYSPLFRDFRTWKRYEGGWAEQLYIFDLSSFAARKITEDVHTHRDPMWIGAKVYYDCDSNGKLNLFAYDTAPGTTEMLTHNDKYDLRWPSTDHKNQIVYELNGELEIYDISAGKSRRVSIEVPDDGVRMRPAHITAAGDIEDFDLSPKGERALFAARGDIFTAPIEKGPTRNLTDSSNAHDKWASWSPDGARIAFISDIDGEEEVYVINQDGSGKPEEMTHGLHAMLYQPVWAHDGKRLAFSDKDGKLFVLTLEGKKLDEIARDASGALRDYTWSHEGGHLAFTMHNPNHFRSLYVWDVADAKTHRVTDDFFDASEPAWDTKTNYLYYGSVHDFAPRMSEAEFEFATDRGRDILALALRKDVKNPFPPESDEVTVGKEGEKAEAGTDKEEAGKEKKKEEKKEEAKPGYFSIDYDGLAQRVTRVPVPGDDYGGLTVTEDYLVYVRNGGRFYDRPEFPDAELRIFSLKDRKETTLAEDVRGFTVSADGKKVLARIKEDFKLYDVKPEGKSGAKTVSTAGLMVDRVPQQEWEEMFKEVWRRYRDFFYARNMNGYDWEALRKEYEPLVRYVADRSELNFLLGEMIAELDNSHTYITGGDENLPERAQVALPGARFELDAASGRYRISKIFAGQNEEEIYRSPLTEVGVDAKVGDFVLAIDGADLAAGQNPYEMLRNKAGNAVQLTLNSKPSLESARKVSFRPITSEANLLYLEWVTHNRDYVSKATQGRVGYMHIPDMGGPGIREFIKYFYPQIRKEGLIVDDRGNGGGNVSQMIIERLSRRLLGTGFGRTTDYTSTYPGTVFYGSMVCLINETSASDGDIFPHMFREAGLGPLIGKRTWGGVVGITDRGPLLDGGAVYVPEFFAAATPAGKYIIEGHGVDPDIAVENDPASVIAGKDPQLDRAITEVLKAMEAAPKKLPSRPPDPVKAPPSMAAPAQAQP
jgi:tricorn protease